MTVDEKRQALRAAAQWLARRSGAPDDMALQDAWRRWCMETPTNHWAWQRVERLQLQLGKLPSAMAYEVLDHAPVALAQLNRRSLLKGIIVIGGVSGLGWSGYRQAPLWMADQRTAIGERRSLQLADGTRLTLNTSTAVDIQFDAQVRLIKLRAGEIQVQTGKDPRPFIVRSAQGDMQALGTRFDVRQHAGTTTLSVSEHAVQVRLGNGRIQRVDAGQTMSFSRDDFGPLQAAAPGSDSWVEGLLRVDDWPLQRLLGELSRYRPGYLGCSDDAGSLVLSGVFPLDNTELALAAIARALPVQVLQRTRYWTRVLKKT